MILFNYIYYIYNYINNILIIYIYNIILIIYIYIKELTFQIIRIKNSPLCFEFY